jgi:hypothetical protein
MKKSFLYKKFDKHMSRHPTFYFIIGLALSLGLGIIAGFLITYFFGIRLGGSHLCYDSLCNAYTYHNGSTLITKVN